VSGVPKGRHERWSRKLILCLLGRGTEEEKILIKCNNDDGYYDLWSCDSEKEHH